jgi:hypothetical protein
MDIKVKKEKVIREFREELKTKGLEKREVYEELFFEILNRVYTLKPKEMRCHLSRLNSLSFLVILDHTYIFIEWSVGKNPDTLLSITMFDDFENGGIYFTSLDNALNIIEDTCKTKT